MAGLRFLLSLVLVCFSVACSDGGASEVDAGIAPDGTADAGGTAQDAADAGQDAGPDSPCQSVVLDVYESDLPLDDPCRLPGAEVMGPPQPEPADPAAGFDPTRRGPYPIGVTTIRLTSDDRPIVVEVWYPADSSSVGQPTEMYTFPEQAPAEACQGIEEACMDIDAHDSGAVRDALPSTEGPFNLIIFSHGTTSTRVQSASQTYWLATHGFVVASPDHTGDTMIEFFETQGGQNPLDDPLSAIPLARDRVSDISTIIDHVEAETQLEGSCFHNLVDTSNVGVFGHSFGGFTSLAASIGVILGVAGPDERVTAIVPIAPGGASFARKGVEDPLLLMSGELDQVIEFEGEARGPYDDAVGPRHLVKVLGAGHLTPSDMCLFHLDELVDVFGYGDCAVCTIVKEGCPGGIEKMDEVRPAMQYFLASFFVHYFGEGPRAERAGELLDPQGPGPTLYPHVWSQVEAW